MRNFLETVKIGTFQYVRAFDVYTQFIKTFKSHFLMFYTKIYIF